MTKSRIIDRLKKLRDRSMVLNRKIEQEQRKQAVVLEEMYYLLQDLSEK